MKFGKTYGNHQIPEWSEHYLDYKELKHIVKMITTKQLEIMELERIETDENTNNSSTSQVNHQQDINKILDTLQNPDIKNLLSQFLIEFEKNIEKVDEFFNKQFAEYDRRLRKLMNDPVIIEAQSVKNANTNVSTLGNMINGYSSRPGSQSSNFKPQYDSNKNQHMVNVNGVFVSENHRDIESKEMLDEYIVILIELRSSIRKLKWYSDLNKRACVKILKKLDKKCGTDQQERFLKERIYSLDFTNSEDLDIDLENVNELLDVISYDSEMVNDLKNMQLGNDTNGSNLFPGNSDFNHNTDIGEDIITKLLKKDDGEGLINELIYMYRSVVLIPTRSLVSLLNKAALLQSYRCIDEILEIIPSLEDHNDINKRNFFHHHVIALGKKYKKQTTQENSTANINADSTAFYNVNSVNTQKGQINNLLSIDLNDKFITPAMEHERQLVGSFGPDGVNSYDSPVALTYILEKLPLHLRVSILKKDTYKRTPLHYAAQYGLVEVTKIIIQNLKSWDAWNSDVAIDDASFWADSENLTPLHLAVMGTHPVTIQTLMSFVNPEVKANSQRLLFMATKLNSPELIKSLLAVNGFDINYKDEKHNGDTVLHVAARLNLLEAAECLIENGANTEIKENNYGWTPIFVAASEGFKDICELLLNKGHCNIGAFDDGGWTPMEHAALKGHLEVSRLLSINVPTICAPVMAVDEPERSKSPFTSSSSTKSFYKVSDSTSSINGTNTTINGNISMESIINDSKKSRHQTKKHLIQESLASVHQPHPQNAATSTFSSKSVKSFGHEYLKQTESFISITLGSNDTSHICPALTLNKVPFTQASSTSLDTALSLMITCPTAIDHEPVLLDLPLDETTNAVNFKVPFREDQKHTICFDLVPTYGLRPTLQKRGSSFDDEKPHGRFSRRGSNYTSSNSFSSSKQNALSSKNSRRHSTNNGTAGLISGSKQNKPKILGRAVALLDTATTKVGKKKRSLQDTVTVPIMSSENMEILGTLNFEFLLVNPFHTNGGVSMDKVKSWFTSDTYWKQLVSTRVIGHRGLGKNIETQKTLQLGENTMESFIAAASLGASYVEFDVQLTKDDVPVIYHDFLVAESGVDIPMHELTLEQFLDLNNIDNEKDYYHEKNLDYGSDVEFSGQAGQANIIPHSSSVKSLSLDNNNGAAGNQKTSSRSSSTTRRRRRSVDDSEMKKLAEKEHANSIQHYWERRMRYTKTYKEKNYKGNFRGSSIASSFVTLKDVFKKLPNNIGFNIECKYPMTDEATSEEMSQVTVEMNHWVDTVLQTVYANCGSRDIIFSSFHPDICIMLSLKQPNFPVLYLTEAGASTMFDARALSLQSAVRFAKTWNLLGLVSAAAPIVQAPRLAQVVKSNGLVLFTYGVQNNDPENARKEIQAGVDAVIVDSVLAVRKGLTRDSIMESSPQNSFSDVEETTTTANTAV